MLIRRKIEMKKKNNLSKGIVSMLIAAVVFLLSILPGIYAVVTSCLFLIDRKPTNYDVTPEMSVFAAGVISYLSSIVSSPFAFGIFIISLIVFILFIVIVVVNKRNPDNVFGFALAQAIFVLINVLVLISEWILNGIICLAELGIFGWIVYRSFEDWQIPLLSVWGWPLGIAVVMNLLVLPISIALLILSVFLIYKVSSEHKSIQAKKTIS